MQTSSLMKDIEIAELLGCSRATFWRRVADGTFPQPIKIGRTSRWTAEEIQSVISNAIRERDYQGSEMHPVQINA